MTIYAAAVATMVGVVDGQGTVESPGLSAPAEKRKKVEKDKASTSKSVKSSEKPAKSSESRPTKSSTDARFENLVKHILFTIRQQLI